MNTIQNRMAIVTGLIVLFIAVNIPVAIGKSQDAHYPMIFIGGASSTDESAFSLGFNYEFLLPNSKELLGLGLSYDHTFFNNQSNQLIFLAFFHPLDLDEYGELRLSIGPGIEFGRSSGTNLMFQFGLAWIFHINQYLLSPTLNFNFIGKKEKDIFSERKTTSWGLSLGRAF